MLAISLFSGQDGGGLDDVHGSDSVTLYCYSVYFILSRMLQTETL